MADGYSHVPRSLACHTIPSRGTPRDPDLSRHRTHLYYRWSLLRTTLQTSSQRARVITTKDLGVAFLHNTSHNYEFLRCRCQVTHLPYQPSSGTLLTVTAGSLTGPCAMLLPQPHPVVLVLCKLVLGFVLTHY